MLRATAIHVISILMITNNLPTEKDAGVLMRKKYRIRIYNFQDHYIRLERKKRKFGAYIYKRESAPPDTGSGVRGYFARQL